jgi:hypothetical protein
MYEDPMSNAAPTVWLPAGLRLPGTDLAYDAKGLGGAHHRDRVGEPIAPRDWTAIGVVAVTPAVRGGRS